MWCWGLVIMCGWCCWGLIIFHGWRCWGLVVLFVGGGGVPLSRRLWVVVVVVHPRGFSCTVWSCRHLRVRVVGGRSCLRALHPSSLSLASFLCAVIVCRPRRMSSASHVLIVVVCPRCVVVSCPPHRCPMLLSLPCPCCDVSFGCTTWHLC